MSDSKKASQDGEGVIGSVAGNAKVSTLPGIQIQRPALDLEQVQKISGVPDQPESKTTEALTNSDQKCFNQGDLRDSVGPDLTRTDRDGTDGGFPLQTHGKTCSRWRRRSAAADPSQPRNSFTSTFQSPTGLSTTM